MSFSYTKNIEIMFFLCVAYLSFTIDNVLVQIILYNMVAFFLTFSISKTYDSVSKRLIVTVAYCLLLSIQVCFVLLSDLSSTDRVIAVLLLIPSFLIEYFFLRFKCDNDDETNMTLVDSDVITKDLYCLETPPVVVRDSISFADFKIFSSNIRGKLQRLKDSGEIVTTEIVRDVMSDLPRNCSIKYVNKSTLSEEYLANLEDCLEDPYVYIVLSDTGSPASSLIGVISQKTYNHVSVAFDEDLNTLISYNGGERITPPGLNPEMIEWLFKKDDASIMIYRLKVSREQKEKMMNRIREIDEDGSAYNLIGMALKKSFKSQPNIMFCSQFVYNMLEEIDANYFVKTASEVKPTDLVELDYERKLEFVSKICFFE